MSNEQSLKELKLLRELSCNEPNHLRSQIKLKKEGVNLNLVFFILKKLYKKLLLELSFRKLQLELKKYSLRHFLEWNIIKYYKNLGFNYYCLGHSFYFSTGLKEEIDAKHKRIGLLKTRFGGDQYPEHFFRIQRKNKNAFEE